MIVCEPLPVPRTNEPNMWQHWSAWVLLVEAKLGMLKESKYRLIQDATLLRRSMESSKEGLKKKVEHLEKRLQEALRDPRKNLSDTCPRLASMDARLSVVGQRTGVLEDRKATGKSFRPDVKAGDEVTLQRLGDLETRPLAPKLERVYTRRIAGEQKLAEQVKKIEVVNVRLRKLGQICALQKDQQVTKNKEFDDRLRKLEEQTKYQEEFRQSSHYSHLCTLALQKVQLEQMQHSVIQLEGETRKSLDSLAAWTAFQHDTFLDFLDDNLNCMQEQRLEDVKNTRATPDVCLRREDCFRRFFEALSKDTRD